MSDKPAAENKTADREADARARKKDGVSMDELVDRWWDDHFPGSPVAENTVAWNHAMAAKEELKRRLIAASR